MNVLMINPVHPSTPHISAARAWRFAQELAHRGHRVVLVTSDRTGHFVEGCPRFESHNWREPFVYSCGSLSQVESGRQLPRLLRKGATAAAMFLDGGIQGDWVRASVRAAAGFKSAFRPDIVWATFGAMEAVFAAKRIAKEAECPWVLDVKDNWELYVPRGIRRLIAMRTGGFSALTANSQLTAKVAARWYGAPPVVIYSGVEQDFYPANGGDECNRKEFVVNLIGSVYDSDRLSEFFRAMQSWIQGLGSSERATVVVRYLGGDEKKVEAAAARNLPDCRIDVIGFVPVDRLAKICKAAAVNVYIAFHLTFHHKLLELLACGRPVLAFPSEHPESIGLVSEVGGDMVIADSADALVKALRRILTDWAAGTIGGEIVDSGQRFSWPNQAADLERVLLSVCASSARR